jgi:hypothetical protein
MSRVVRNNSGMGTPHSSECEYSRWSACAAAADQIVQQSAEEEAQLIMRRLLREYMELRAQ